MRFFLSAALFGFLAVMVAARARPSRLNGEELWGRTDSTSSTCDGSAMKTCAMALVPTVAACGLAAAQGELDVINDVACIGAAVDLGVNFPSTCTACAKKFGNKVETEVEKVESKLESIF